MRCLKSMTKVTFVLKRRVKKMLEVKRDDFDESLEDIMNSINEILKNTGKGYETKEEEKDIKGF